MADRIEEVLNNNRLPRKTVFLCDQVLLYPGVLYINIVSVSCICVAGAKAHCTEQIIAITCIHIHTDVDI